jgi:putative transferase (TIGR04331 family)
MNSNIDNYKRYLITTANEQTWKFDRPVIFLGDWCRLYDRKHIWQDMDAIVAKPYGLGQDQKDLDHADARAVEENLFPILCNVLNQYHGAQYGDRFWKIVMGHWFRRYVEVILNRLRTLEQCLDNYQLSGTTALAVECYSITPLDSYSAIWAFNDDRCNNALYVRILSLLGGGDCPLETITSEASEGFCFRVKAGPSTIKRRILKWGFQQLRTLVGVLKKDDDIFIINSYLPKKEEIKLQLALRQVPQLWESLQFSPTNKPNSELRRELTERITMIVSNTENSSDKLLTIACSLVFELLPICYLEGFSELTEKVRLLPWPNKPRIIFTSNNFDTDEIFKLWTATKIEFGSKYVTGQHGNNYGTSRYMNSSIEESTADEFLTWGWTDGLSQHVPAFLFKTARCKAESYDPKGGLLLIEIPVGQMITTWDIFAEFKEYFEEQQIFIRKLQPEIKPRLIVRLHPACNYFGWGEKMRWGDFDPAIRIDNGSTKLSKLLGQSRLVVHSYDSTGILETLSQNIPTLAFWQNDFEHLRDSAKPYYQLLVDAGIVHLSPESIAVKVNEIWDNVEAWWSQNSVQIARRQFCNQFARTSQNPICELKELLR